MNRTIRFFVLPTLIFCLSLSATAQYHWDEGGIQLRESLNLKWRGASVTNQSGETYIVWEDCRNGIRSIFGQKYSLEGQALWEESGIDIGGMAINPEEKPAIALTEDGGFIVIWGQISEIGWTDIMAQRMDPDGNRLWNETGVVVRSVAEPLLDIMAISDDASGALITWDVMNEGEYCNIYAQRIDFQGNIFPGWDPMGVIVAMEQDNTIDFIDLDICSDSENGIFICWSTSGGFDLYAQRVTAEGEVAWASEMPVCTQTGTQEYFDVASDDNGGMYCIWEDHRASPISDIYMQRIDLDGNPLWTADGIQINTIDLDQYHPVLQPDGFGGAIAAWERGNTYWSDNNLYCQRIDGDGNFIWENSGVILCDQFSDINNYSIAPDGNGGAFFVWVDERGGEDDYDIYAQYVNSGGSVQWQDDGIQLSDQGYWCMPIVNYLNDGGAMFAWKGWIIDEGLYIQKADAGGNLYLPVNGLPVIEGLGGGTESYMRMTFIPPDRVVSVWLDGRVYDEYNLYYQIYDMQGNELVEINGLPCTSSDYNHSDYQITATSDGGVMLTWNEKENSSTQNVRAQKINSQGMVQWAPNGRQITDWDHIQFTPKICPDDEGGTFIAFRSYNGLSYTNPDIYVQRVADDGSLPWGAVPFELTYDDRPKYLRGIVEDGEGGAIVCWEWRISYPPQNSDIYAARMLADGDTAWTQVICNLPSHQINPNIISSHDGGAIIAWEDQRGGNYNIFAQKIDNDGNCLWTENGVPVRDLEEDNAEHPLMVEDDEGYVYFIYEDGIGFGYRSLYCQRLDPAGNRMFSYDGVLISDESYYLETLGLVSDNEGGIYVTWDDDRADNHDEVYITHLDERGNYADPIWIGSGNPLGEGYGRRKNPVITSDGQGGAVIGWLGSHFQIPTSYCPFYDSELYVQRVNEFVAYTEDPVSVIAPAVFDLYQNYPNPFNQRAVISYKMQATSYINLTVYDILGREVARLVDGYRNAGTHEVIFDAKDLVSGVYFVRLKAGGFKQTRKMLMVK